MTPQFGVSSPPCAGSCSSSSSRWACAGDAQAQDRYSLVGGCYALKSAATGKFVANTADGGYRATAGRPGGRCGAAPDAGHRSRTGCRPARARLSRRGLAGARLGASPSSLLKRAGQPRVRGARRWTYCVKGGRMSAALTRSGHVALVGSTARGHKARGVRPGAKMKKGRAIRRQGRFVYVVRHRRVQAVAVTKAKSRKVIRRQLKTAGLV